MNHPKTHEIHVYFHGDDTKLDTIIKMLKEIARHLNDPAALAALTDKLKTSGEELAEAVKANEMPE